MKKFIIPMVMFAVVMLLGSCGSTKKVAYFQNADYVNLSASKGLYDAKIMPKDMLTITVTTTDPQAATPFNLSVGSTLSASGSLGGGSNSLQTYLVDNKGIIRFPVIGELHVEGLTIRQCEDMIKEHILPYLAVNENPIVTVRMANFRVTIMGEVGSPGSVVAPAERMSILDALAQAGDLTIYGKRDNVMLIREDFNGEKKIHYLNLNDANLLTSPYYYLQQNDIVYVEPNKVKARNSSIGTSTTLWFSVFGILTSTTSLIYNIVNK